MMVLDEKLFVQCNSRRILTPSALGYVPYKPHFHCAVLSLGTRCPRKIKSRYQEEDSAFVFPRWQLAEMLDDAITRVTVKTRL